MGFFQKIKDWLTGKSNKSGGSTGGTKRSGGGGSRYEKAPTGNYGSSVYYRRALVRQRQEEKEKKEKVAKAFKVKEFQPNQAKAEAAKKAPTPIQSVRQNIANERAAYNKATNNRYNVKGAKTSAERLKRRQAQKSQAFDAEAAKFEYKYHPVMSSLTRGALSGVTFGLSDLAAAKLTSKEAKGAEEFYQANKNRAAEFAGEMAGSLIGFGLTGEASAKGVKAAAKALAPKAFEKGTARAVERTASSKLIRRAAEKEAMKRFGADKVTEEIIASIAKRRAERAVAELGKDAAINLTTGLVSDVSNSLVDSENWQEFAKNMGVNAAMNVGMGAATSLVPAFRVGNAKADTEVLESLLERASRNVDNEIRPGEAVNIREMARTPQYTRQGILAGAESADQALDRALVADADNVRIGDLVGDRQVRVNPDAPEGIVRDANRQRTLDRLVENAERGVPEGNAEAPLNSLLNIPDQSEAAKNARIREINAELDAVNNDILARQAVLSDSELKELNDRFSALMDERTALEDSMRGSASASADASVADAEQILKEEQAESKVVSAENKTDEVVSSEVKPKKKRKKEKSLQPKEQKQKAQAPEAKASAKASATNAVDEEAEKLIARDGEIDKRLAEIVDSEYWAHDKHGTEEYATLKKEYDSLVKEQRKIQKQMGALDKASAPKSESVDDFAQVGGKEAQDMGITPDAEVKPVPKQKAETPEPNTVGVSKGQNLGDEVDKELGTGTGAERKPPETKDVIKVEKQYNIEQASKDKDVVSRTAVTLFRNTSSDEQVKSIKRLIKNDSLNYNRITNEGMMTDVAKQFHGDPERYTKELMSYADGTKELLQKDARDVQYMSWYVVNHTGPILKEHPELAPLHDACAELVTDLSSQSGQILQLNGVMMKASPLARRRSTIKSIANMLDKSVGVRNKGVTIDGVRVPLSGDRDARIKQLIGIIEKDGNMKAALDKLEKATSDREFDAATAEVMRASMRLKTRTAIDLFQQWRIAGMLGNPKTMIRNRVGNAVFGNIRQVSNTSASLVESYLAKHSKSQFVKTELETRTRGGIDLNIRRQSRIKGEKLKDAAAKDAYNAWLDVESHLTSGGKYETKAPSGSSDNVAVKALDWWTDFVSGRLEKDDAKALERNFREAYMKGAKKLKANGKDLADEAIKEKLVQRAVEEAKIATFREYNAAADTLTKWTNHLYDADSSAGRKALGFAVEAAIPFRKTPMNILKQSMNYSPLGVARGFKNIRKAAMGGDAELLHTAIDQFASGLTGSGIMIGGFALGYMTDSFTTNAGSKDFDSKFMKQQGVQNYSVTYTDPVTGKAHSYTLDWLVPASTTFFAGVELANQLKEADGFSLFDFSKNIGEVAARVIEPVFETSMLSGIYNIMNDLQGNGSSDDTLGAPSIILREIGQNYLNSLIPTAVGQISRTIYRSDKQLNGESDMEYFVNQIKSKMGLANTDIITSRLGADTTAYGKVKNDKGKSLAEAVKDRDAKVLARYGLSLAKNMALPMNIQEVDLDEVDQSIIDEYQKRVRAGEDPDSLSYLFAKKQYNKNFKMGDEAVKMTNTELSTYNQAKETGGAEGMRLALEGIMFNRYEKDADGKRTILKNGYTEEQKKKLIAKFEGKSLREVQEWLYKQPQFKTATEAERKKVLSHMWSLSSQGKAQGAKRVGERAVIESRGGDVSEYDFNNEITDKKRSALQPYIDAGVLTYEEAVDFARDAGKTYYYENDEGGSTQTYFNKKQMIEYLEKKGYDHDKAEALFNSFKNSNAKPYDGTSSSGRRGYRRRGYRRRGYRRRGGRSKSVVKQTMNSSAYKTKTFTPKVKAPAPKSSGSSASKTTLSSALQDIQNTQKKITPPKNK